MTGKAVRPILLSLCRVACVIGRGATIADFGWIKFKGRIARWPWGIAHIHFPTDFRSRFIAAMQWFWSYLTHRRGARLITGAEGGEPTTP